MKLNNRNKTLKKFRKQTKKFKAKVLHLEKILIKLGIAPWDAKRGASNVIRKNKQQELEKTLWN